MILLVNKWRCHLISLPQGAILVIWSVGSRTQLNSYRTISVTFLQQWLQYEQTITTLASSSQPFCLCEGGAERLIVDAACQLASHGHDVHVFTAHHDKNRCFEETVSCKTPNSTYLLQLPMPFLLITAKLASLCYVCVFTHCALSSWFWSTSQVMPMWTQFLRNITELCGWQNSAYANTIFTWFLSDCFAGLFPVTVYGDFLPRHVFYRFHAVCAYLRCLFVALCVYFNGPPLMS